MRSRNCALVGMFFLATCGENPHDGHPVNIELGTRALGQVPPSEVAVWQKVSSSTVPDDRYLEAVAFDEARQVVVVFGGMKYSSEGVLGPCQETLEWSPKTGHWTDRSESADVTNPANAADPGSAPEARSGAAMVFDSVRSKLVLFGGRAASGTDLDDTWEWDPRTGAWTAVSITGSKPPARSHHGMVYEKGMGKILLFGGGQSDPSSADGTGISLSLGDIWEYDPANHAWKASAVTVAPKARYDFGMVWDSGRSRAVLFGGMQMDLAGAPGVPKQDTWEWDPATPAWTERTTAGVKPSPRYGHAMAFDGNRGKMLVFGGSDINTEGGSLNDLWELNPTTGSWTERMTGDANAIPSARMWASLISDDSSGLLELMGGGQLPEALPSRGVWELDPVKPVFVDRTDPSDIPSPRESYAMAYNPSTGKTYLFGGWGNGQYPLDDLWQWDGQLWAEVAVDGRPPGRSDAAMAYDPIRKSLILFGGVCNAGAIGYCDDTWEFSSGNQWTQLAPDQSPPQLAYHGMVTDAGRGRILLFAGANTTGSTPIVDTNEVWEWNGAASTWTNRTPAAFNSMPRAQESPLLAFDEGRQKMSLLDAGTSVLWEWDPISGGWESRDLGDTLSSVYYFMGLTYDSIRRRMVIVLMQGTSDSHQPATWEIDTTLPTLYTRTITPVPDDVGSGQSIFDSKRGAIVAFGNNDTWEYTVSNLGNGEGCTAASVSSCASGLCTEGVCCEVAACAGTCQSCNVPGSEGTCVPALPGAEVPGSCAANQACGSNGVCSKKNGQPCTAKADCASGVCIDGVCCDVSCTGTCASCNQPGREGTCTPFAAGTDPKDECGTGTGVCKSTCDGVGACAWPATSVSCADGLTCNGIGDCSFRNPSLGGSTGTIGGSGGVHTGGVGGSSQNIGGSGGYSMPTDGGKGADGGNAGGAAGSIPHAGGAGGSVPNAGGAGGSSVPHAGGAGGSVPNAGGAGGSVPNAGGAAGSIATRDGSAGTIANAGGSRGSRDAGAGDAGRASARRSGCSCALGGSSLRASRPSVALLFLGAFSFLCRRRRR